MKKAFKIFKLLFLLLILLTLISCNNTDKQWQGYIEGKFTYITAAISGTLDRLFVLRGTQVKAGQILFILDQEPEASNFEAANKKLAQAEQTLQDMRKGSRDTVMAGIDAQKEQALASLELSKRTLIRYRSIIQAGAISKYDLDQAEAKYKADFKRVTQLDANLAEARLGARENALKAQQALVDAARAEVAKASWALEQKTKRTPVDALVFDNLFTVGEMVTAGQPVVSLLTPINIKLVFFVPEKIVSQIKLGSKVSFTCDSCKRSYFSRVTFVSPEAEYTPPVIYSEDSRQKLVYRIEAILSPQDANLFHPGQPVMVKIDKDESVQ